MSRCGNVRLCVEGERNGDGRSWQVFAFICLEDSFINDTVFSYTAVSLMHACLLGFPTLVKKQHLTVAFVDKLQRLWNECRKVMMLCRRYV